MSEKLLGINSVCIHSGELQDTVFKGAISPLYMTTSYDYENQDMSRYPRYFNTPNQQALNQKISDLEHCEASLIFGCIPVTTQWCSPQFMVGPIIF